LIGGAEEKAQAWESISWMIDASHNVKDPLEDLIQALEAISQAYAKALLVDRKKLTEFQLLGDVVGAQEVLQDAFLTDVRTLVCEARIQSGGEADPLAFYRKEKIREKLIVQRGKNAQASGL
jgi:L-rhamnose isomerase/sugar isomerase